MGYLKNNLATVVVAVFAIILSGLYFLLPPVLNFIMIVAITITWFLVFMCWIVQKGQDYSHKPNPPSKKKATAI